MRTRTIEILVGIFMLLGILGFVFLAFKVSGLTTEVGAQDYLITAKFNNIGGLKVRAPVRIAGVTIGRVVDIQLDSTTFLAIVTMSIGTQNNSLPKDSQASIFTEGILGANYIGLTPGFDKQVLRQGDTIEETHSALVLEKLIGQFLFSIKKGSEK